MAAKKTIIRNEPDVGASEAAFNQLEAKLRALPGSEIQSPYAALEEAAIAGLALVDIARAPRRLPRFARLPPEEFPKDTIDALEQAALAAWFVQTKVLSESATTSGAKVDLALMEASGAHLAELLKLIEYHVGEIPEVAAELADIRSGTGYQDRASDLVRAAELFDSWENELREDTRRYDPSAGKRARAYAHSIVTALREGAKDSATWRAMRDRAWTYLIALYHDVELTGAWLFRREPEHGEHFVPLRTMIALVRPRRQRRTPGNDQGVNDQGEPPPAPAGELD